jgi:NAD(P)-dependent dehydrogenase (short-subunit alcohol dehydrogenase family)
VHVIVTGGSSGIGLEVARLYLRAGASVSIIARDAARLERARLDLETSGVDIGGRLHVASADVAVEDEIRAAVLRCESVSGPCDALIAAAGMVEPAPFDEQTSDLFARQIETNLFGTVNSVRAVYAGMKARRSGKIMIVSSGAALIGIHGYSAYCASKSALVGFAEALQAEARPFSVGICICFPPDTLTPQLEAELPKRSAAAQRVMGAAAAWRPQAVAERIVRATDRGTSKLYFGFSLTALGWFGPVIKPVVNWWYAERPGR